MLGFAPISALPLSSLPPAIRAAVAQDVGFAYKERVKKVAPKKPKKKFNDAEGALGQEVRAELARDMRAAFVRDEGEELALFAALGISIAAPISDDDAEVLLLLS